MENPLSVMSEKLKIRSLHVFLFSLFLLSSVNNCFSQTFQEARTLAFSGEREKSRAICRTILAQDFDADVAVLLGRTYAWDGKYDSTRIVIAEVIKRYPEYWDALDALADVEYWDGKYEKAIQYCDIVLKKDPNDENFLLKKAKILNSKGDYDQSVSILVTLLKKYPSNTEALKKLKSIRLDQKKNTLRLNYTYDFFEKDFNRDPWQVGYLSYGRKTSLGSVIARVNYAKRFGSTGFQYEMDAYPSISENNYAYLNFGFSNISIFPKYRGGAEWYHSFPKAFEGSMGVRMLFFSSSNTFIYTASVGKYVGNYWISLRPYITPSSTGTSVSGSIQARRYFSDPGNYVGLRFGYGISPDDGNKLNNSVNYLNLKSQSARIEYNHIFAGKWTFNLGTTLSNEELPNNTGYALNYSFDIGFGISF